MSEVRRIWSALKTMEECGTLEAELDSGVFDNIKTTSELADTLEGAMDYYNEE